MENIKKIYIIKSLFILLSCLLFACKKENCKTVLMYTMQAVPSSDEIKKDTIINNQILCGGELENALRQNFSYTQYTSGGITYRITTIVITK